MSANPVSRYTSFKDCKPVEQGHREDWSASRSPGLGAYDLHIAYGDARDERVLLRRGREPVKFGLIGLGAGEFNALRETAEWRGVQGPSSFAPAWLIVRNTVSEDPANSDKQTSILTVIDLRHACVISQIRPQAGQNEPARGVADGPARRCLK